MIDGIDPVPNAGEDKGAGRETSPMLCRERTWCTLPHGHGGSCVEVPRAPIAATEYGPRRRWERR